MRVIIGVCLLLLLAACGKTPTAIERVCYPKTTTAPIVNMKGDTVSTFTIRQIVCTGGR